MSYEKMSACADLILADAIETVVPVTIKFI